MQQFIKYFMNMRLLARRAEYARGPLLARIFCAFLRAETAGFPGRSKAAGMRNSFGHYHAETICKTNCSGSGLWKYREVEATAPPLDNLLSIKYLNYFKTLRFVLCSKRDSRYDIAKRERNGVLKLQG